MANTIFGPLSFDSVKLGFDLASLMPQYSQYFNLSINDVPGGLYPRNYLKPNYSRTGIIINKFDQVSSISRAMHTRKESKYKN